jgi:hypothetical protein
MTALTEMVEGVLVRIAKNGSTMPNNPMLGQRCAGRGRSSMDRAIRRLAKLGRVRVEIRGSLRRLWVKSCDRWTDWGEARKGHAPFTARARGTPPPEPPPPSAEIVRLPRPVIEQLKVRPSECCQWPLWPDGARPDGRYCERAIFRKSYCAEHHGRAFGANDAEIVDLAPRRRELRGGVFSRACLA